MLLDNGSNAVIEPLYIDLVNRCDNRDKRLPRAMGQKEFTLRWGELIRPGIIAGQEPITFDFGKLKQNHPQAQPETAVCIKCPYPAESLGSACRDHQSQRFGKDDNLLKKCFQETL